MNFGQLVHKTGFVQTGVVDTVKTPLGPVLKLSAIKNVEHEMKILKSL